MTSARRVRTKMDEMIAQEPSADMAGLLALRRHLSIVHHLPGRIRLRVSPAIYSCAMSFDADASRALLGELSGIRKVRLNRQAASIVIEYDPKLISAEEWETLVQGDTAPAVAVLRHWLGRNPSSRLAA